MDCAENIGVIIKQVGQMLRHPDRVHRKHRRNNQAS